MKFWQASKWHNNLNNLGPDVGDEGIRLAKLGEHNGQEFDLYISSVSTRYESPWASWNGLDGLFGYITMGNTTAMDLRFSIIKTGAIPNGAGAFDENDLFPLTKFYFTFFDLDTSDPPWAPPWQDPMEDQSEGAEKLSISGFKQYLLGPDSELAVTTNADGQTCFEATVFGETSDNPINPLKMNTQQKNRAVTLLFENTAEFELTYETTPGGNARGREVFFAGKSQLATDPCGGPEGRQPARSVKDQVPRDIHQEISDYNSSLGTSEPPTPVPR